MKKLTVVEKAYAAAAIDGEGCIMIKHPSTRPTVFNLYVEIVNTDVRLVEFVQKRWGGSLSQHHEPIGSKRKPRWHLQIAAKNAMQLLKDVLPYLVLKKKQAQWGIKFQSQMRYWGSTPRPASYIAFQHKACSEVHKLNKRGR